MLYLWAPLWGSQRVSGKDQRKGKEGGKRGEEYGNEGVYEEGEKPKRKPK